MKVFNFTHNGTEGYLVKGSDEEEQSVRESLVSMDIDWNERYVQDKLFISVEDPMEDQMAKLALETVRDHSNDVVHLTEKEERQL
jgi:hypothetical protein